MEIIINGRDLESIIDATQAAIAASRGDAAASCGSRPATTAAGWARASSTCTRTSSRRSIDGPCGFQRALASRMLAFGARNKLSGGSNDNRLVVDGDGDLGSARAGTRPSRPPPARADARGGRLGEVSAQDRGIRLSLEHPADWTVSNPKVAISIHLAHPTKPAHLYVSAFRMPEGTLQEFAELKFGAQPEFFTSLGPPRALEGVGWNGLVQDAETTPRRRADAATDPVCPARRPLRQPRATVLSLPPLHTARTRGRGQARRAEVLALTGGHLAAVRRCGWTRTCVSAGRTREPRRPGECIAASASPDLAISRSGARTRVSNSYGEVDGRNIVAESGTVTDYSRAPTGYLPYKGGGETSAGGNDDEERDEA